MYRQAAAVDPHGQTSVISTKELKTMRMMTNTTPTLTSEQELQNTRRMVSRSRYQHWPNTLEAQRQKKEIDRKQRLDQIEEAQQQLDERENMYREQEKREAIARANRLMYQENDRVKTFRTSMLLSNALQEREAQRAFNEEYKAMKAEQEAEFNREIEEHRNRVQDRERKEAEARKQKALSATRDLERQMRDKFAKHCDMRRQEFADAMDERQLAIQAELDAKAEERQRMDDSRKQSNDLLAANRDQVNFKKSLQAMNDLEDERISRHAAEKERMQKLRNEYTNERRRQRQDAIDKMISNQHEHLQKLKDVENTRIERQIEAMSKKQEEKEQRQADHRARLQSDLIDGRKQQLERQAADLLMKQEVEKAMGEEWKRMNAMLEGKEKEQELKEKMVSLQLQDTLQSQVVSRQEKDRQTRLEEVRHANRMKKQNEYDDKVFDRYVQHHIREFDAEGKDTLPLKLTVHKMDLKAKRVAY